MDDKATAAKIADDHYEESSGRHERLIAAIVAALEAARDTAFVAGYAAGLDHLRGAVESRSIIDCTGEVPVVRRVLGTLPITKDGCVVGYAAENEEALSAFYIDGDQIIEGAMACIPQAMFNDPNGLGIISPNDGAVACYSTHEAAKAAMEGGK